MYVYVLCVWVRAHWVGEFRKEIRRMIKVIVVFIKFVILILVFVFWLGAYDLSEDY